MRLRLSLRQACLFGGYLVASTILPGNAVAQQDGGQSNETVVVTATRTEKELLETPAAVTVRSVDELRAEGFTYGTDEFRGVPGVYFRRGEGDADEFPFVSIRGVTGNHGNDTFLALIDGVPFVGPDEEVLLTEVPYAAVEQIDIVRGPVSALYGRGAIAGAINYITRTPREDATSLSLSAGSDDYYRAEAVIERKIGDAGILASISYEDYEGWRENSARSIGNIFLKGVIPLSDRGELTTYLNVFDREAEVPSAIPALADGTVVDVLGGVESFLGHEPTRNNVEGWIGAARYAHEVNDNLTLTFTGQARRFESDVRLNFYDYFEFDPANSIFGVNGFASRNDTDVFVGEATAEWSLGRHTLVGGVSAERATLDEQDNWSGQNDPFFDGSCGFKFYAILVNYETGEVVNRNDPCFVVDEPRTASEATNTFWGAFIQDEIALTDALTLTVGARYDAFEREIDFSIAGAAPTNERATGDEGAFAPKVALDYDYGPGIVYASFGRGFNSNFGPAWQWDPAQYERVEKPTTIDSYELGWKGRALDGGLEWETAIFYLEQENRRTFVTNPDPTGPSTLATTGQLYSSQGLEASLRVFPTDATSMMINYTYLDPKWEEFTVDTFGGPLDFSGTTPQGVPEHMFYAELKHDFTSWLTARATYEWYDDYFITVDNSASDGQFDLLNLSATVRHPEYEDVAVDLSVTNVLDEEYFYYFGGSRTAVTNVSPGVPRQFRATLRYAF